MLAIPAGTLLTSNATTISPALTEGKKYELVKITPMYLNKEDETQFYTTESSAGPLSHFIVTIKRDDKEKELKTPACNFHETTDILSQKTHQP